MGKFLIRNGFPNVGDAIIATIGRRLDSKEVHDALFGMAPLKAPGIDGLHAQFFQTQWNIVGESLISMVRGVFENGMLDEFFNKTLLVLIPKVAGPEFVTQFRPISLCTVPYKVLTKVLANRLKSIMPTLVEENETTFVGGRHIINNVLIAQEVIHSMKGRKGKKKMDGD